MNAWSRLVAVSVKHRPSMRGVTNVAPIIGHSLISTYMDVPRCKNDRAIGFVLTASIQF